VYDQGTELELLTGEEAISKTKNMPRYRTSRYGFDVAGETGLEPATNGFGDRYSTD
jgi:hypothetical protein